MTGLELIIVSWLGVCFLWGKEVNPEKKKEDDKTPEKEFAAAFEKYLSKGLKVRIEEDP
ncbi:MAG: hypothetical protein KME20_25590 [Kaiparowitsia implicata GSE-PSE-MK54-09C]|jgi:hypothetical protein|nr:hypothetical protein [Kaiparowitsia implicata GSE-PSE-MK54-09C]